MMKILVLAPHPFFQERGTPIAVKLLIQVLADLNHEVHLLTYHEGADIEFEGNVSIHRIEGRSLPRNIRPGFSLKKLVCDAYMYPQAIRMVKTGNYDVIHAVEESAFMALRLNKRFSIPYVFDMDSSMPQQIVERLKVLRPLLPMMTAVEKHAIKRALAVLPMCDTLADMAVEYGANKAVVLHDISLLDNQNPSDPEEVRTELGITDLCFMYVGNMEPYQGIDLLLEGFSGFVEAGGIGQLVIAGGIDEHIDKYSTVARACGLEERVSFIGQQPISRMASLFNAADVLVSPRTEGVNTPMKIYSYLASGKPVLATSIASHTQVLSDETAVLTAPNPDQLTNGMLALAKDEELRTRLGQRGKALADEKYSAKAFRQTLLDLYQWIEHSIKEERQD